MASTVVFSIDTAEPHTHPILARARKEMYDRIYNIIGVPRSYDAYVHKLTTTKVIDLGPGASGVARTIRKFNRTHMCFPNYLSKDSLELAKLRVGKVSTGGPGTTRIDCTKLEKFGAINRAVGYQASTAETHLWKQVLPFERDEPLPYTVCHHRAGDCDCEVMCVPAANTFIIAVHSWYYFCDEDWLNVFERNPGARLFVGTHVFSRDCVLPEGGPPEYQVTLNDAERVMVTMSPACGSGDSYVHRDTTKFTRGFVVGRLGQASRFRVTLAREVFYDRATHTKLLEFKFERVTSDSREQFPRWGCTRAPDGPDFRVGAGPDESPEHPYPLGPPSSLEIRGVSITLGLPVNLMLRLVRDAAAPRPQVPAAHAIAASPPMSMTTPPTVIDGVGPATATSTSADPVLTQTPALPCSVPTHDCAPSDATSSLSDRACDSQSPSAGWRDVTGVTDVAPRPHGLMTLSSQTHLGSPILSAPAAACGSPTDPIVTPVVFTGNSLGSSVNPNFGCQPTGSGFGQDVQSLWPGLAPALALMNTATPTVFAGLPPAPALYAPMASLPTPEHVFGPMGSLGGRASVPAPSACNGVGGVLLQPGAASVPGHAAMPHVPFWYPRQCAPALTCWYDPAVYGGSTSIMAPREVSQTRSAASFTSARSSTASNIRMHAAMLRQREAALRVATVTTTSSAEPVRESAVPADPAIVHVGPVTRATVPVLAADLAVPVSTVGAAAAVSPVAVEAVAHAGDAHVHGVAEEFGVPEGDIDPAVALDEYQRGVLAAYGSPGEDNVSHEPIVMPLYPPCGHRLSATSWLGIERNFRGYLRCPQCRAYVHYLNLSPYPVGHARRPPMYVPGDPQEADQAGLGPEDVPDDAPMAPQAPVVGPVQAAVVVAVAGGPAVPTDALMMAGAFVFWVLIALVVSVIFGNISRGVAHTAGLYVVKLMFDSGPILGQIVIVFLPAWRFAVAVVAHQTRGVRDRITWVLDCFAAIAAYEWGVPGAAVPGTDSVLCAYQVATLRSYGGFAALGYVVLGIVYGMSKTSFLAVFALVYAYPLYVWLRTSDLAATVEVGRSVLVNRAPAYLRRVRESWNGYRGVIQPLDLQTVDPLVRVAAAAHVRSMAVAAARPGATVSDIAERALTSSSSLANHSVAIPARDRVPGQRYADQFEADGGALSTAILNAAGHQMHREVASAQETAEVLFAHVASVEASSRRGCRWGRKIATFLALASSFVVIMFAIDVFLAIPFGVSAQGLTRNVLRGSKLDASPGHHQPVFVPLACTFDAPDFCEPMGPGDFYWALGIPPTENASEIARAYRQLARAYHPDRPLGHLCPGFRLIMHAFEVLRHPACAQVYFYNRQYPACEQECELVREGWRKLLWKLVTDGSVAMRQRFDRWVSWAWSRVVRFVFGPRFGAGDGRGLRPLMPHDCLDDPEFCRRVDFAQRECRREPAQCVAILATKLAYAPAAGVARACDVHARATDALREGADFVLRRYGYNHTSAAYADADRGSPANNATIKGWTFRTIVSQRFQVWVDTILNLPRRLMHVVLAPFAHVAVVDIARSVSKRLMSVSGAVKTGIALVLSYLGNSSSPDRA